MYAFTYDCRPGAVQKIPQFRTLRKRLTKILTISSARDDPGLWGYVLRGGEALLYPDPEPRQYSSTASTAVQPVQQYSQYSIHRSLT